MRGERIATAIHHSTLNTKRSSLNTQRSTFIHAAHTLSTNQTATQSPLGNRGCAVPTDRLRTDITTLKESPNAGMGALLQSADDV